MDAQLCKWLESINLQFGQDGIPYTARPFDAMNKLSVEYGINVVMPSQFATDIFNWFENRSPVGAHAVGSLFPGAFYYDAYFWRVEVPISYGIKQISALDALDRMPATIRTQLQSNRETMYKFVELWADVMDYGYGMDDLGEGARLPVCSDQPFALKITASAHRKLNATVHLLTESESPSSESLESARMATEMFMKAYLAVHGGLSEKEGKLSFGHNLLRLANECIKIKSKPEFEEISDHLKIFPPIDDRYENSHYANDKLWIAYAIAQRTAVTFTRSLTDRDCRDQFLAAGPTKGGG